MQSERGIYQIMYNIPLVDKRVNSIVHGLYQIAFKIKHLSTEVNSSVHRIYELGYEFYYVVLLFFDSMAGDLHILLS